MTIGDDIAAALPGLQAQAESMMRGTVVITDLDPDAEPVMNPETWQTEQPIVTLYTGPYRLKAVPRRAGEATVADQVFAESQFIISLPARTTGIRKNAVAQIESGRKFRIVTVGGFTDQTALRLAVIETQ